MDRESRLAEFDTQRDRFLKAFRSAPSEAMSFRKDGDDYALGGLVVHVNFILERYRRVLDRLVATSFGSFQAEDPPEEVAETEARTRAGLLPDQVAIELEAMETRHRELAAAVRSLPAADWQRKGQVVYDEGGKAYQTGAEDLLCWLSEHYGEHVDQVGELLSEWQLSRQP